MKYTTLLIMLIAAQAANAQGVDKHCAQCLGPYLNPTAPADGGETMPKVVVNTACTNKDFNENGICGKFWKTFTDGVCCTQASVKAIKDWLVARYGKNGKGAKGPKEKLEKVKEGNGKAEKIDKLEKAIKKNKAKLKEKGYDVDKMESKVGKKNAKKGKVSGDGAKKQGGLALGHFKKCLFHRTNLGISNLCYACTTKAKEEFDAAANALKVAKVVCQNFFKRCSRVYAILAMDTEAEQMARALLEAQGKDVSKIPELTPEASALLLKIIEADNEETLASVEADTLEFCKLMNVGIINPAVTGDGKETDVDGATSDVRLLMAHMNRGELSAASRVLVSAARRRVLATSSYTFLQVSSGGADLSTVDNGAQLSENDFEDSAKILTALISAVALFLHSF